MKYIVTKDKVSPKPKELTIYAPYMQHVSVRWKCESKCEKVFKKWRSHRSRKNTSESYSRRVLLNIHFVECAGRVITCWRAQRSRARRRSPRRGRRTTTTRRRRGSSGRGRRGRGPHCCTHMWEWDIDDAQFIITFQSNFHTKEYSSQASHQARKNFTFRFHSEWFFSI